MSTESSALSLSHIQNLFELLPQAKKCDVGRLKSRLLNIKKVALKDAAIKNTADHDAIELTPKQLKLVEQLQSSIVKSINEKQKKISNVPHITYPDGLPISENAKSVAVIGPLADAPHEQQGTWSFDGKKEDSQTPLNAFRAMKNITVNYAAGLKMMQVGLFHAQKGSSST